MGTMYRYVFCFTKDQKQYFDDLTKLLEDDGEVIDTDGYDAQHGGYVQLECNGRDIEKYLMGLGFKGMCKIEVTCMEPDPDKFIDYDERDEK
jgi:hypothetical protein